jgi:hypothetical protein
LRWVAEFLRCYAGDDRFKIPRVFMHRNLLRSEPDWHQSYGASGEAYDAGLMSILGVVSTLVGLLRNYDRRQNRSLSWIAVALA